MCHLCDMNMPVTKFILIPEKGNGLAIYKVIVGSQIYKLMKSQLGDVAESFKVISSNFDEKTILFTLGIKTLTLSFKNG